MANENKPIGAIATGAVSTIKAGAINADEQSKKDEAQDKQEAAQLTPGVGDVLYTKVGEPVFNIMYGAQNRRISFIGGKYMIRSTDKDAEAICEALDYFVDQGILTRDDGAKE